MYSEEVCEKIIEEISKRPLPSYIKTNIFDLDDFDINFCNSVVEQTNNDLNQQGSIFDTQGISSNVLEQEKIYKMNCEDTTEDLFAQTENIEISKHHVNNNKLIEEDNFQMIPPKTFFIDESEKNSSEMLSSLNNRMLVDSTQLPDWQFSSAIENYYIVPIESGSETALNEDLISIEVKQEEKCEENIIQIQNTFFNNQSETVSPNKLSSYMENKFADIHPYEVSSGIFSTQPLASTSPCILDNFCVLPIELTSNQMVINGNVKQDNITERLNLGNKLEFPPTESEAGIHGSPTYYGNRRTTLCKCLNCSQIFDKMQFSKHNCEYNEHKKKIDYEEIKTFMDEEIEEPPCIKQLQENQERIIKLLREFNYNEDTLTIELLNQKTTPKISDNNKKVNGPFECTICERKFVHASGLQRHIEKHATDKIQTFEQCNIDNNTIQTAIECLICGKLSFTQKDNADHINEKHKNILCDTENDNGRNVTNEKIIEAINVIDKFELNEGMDVVTYDFPFQMVIINSILRCEFCDDIYSNVADLLTHSSLHDPKNRFECSSCNMKLKTYKELVLHWQCDCPFERQYLTKNWTFPSYFVCNVCENKFSSYEQLYDHRYSSYHFFPRVTSLSELLQLSCEYCGNLYENAKCLMKHYGEKHVKKTVRREITTTTRYRHYLCDICGKSYTQSSHLWQHLRFHKGVKPFACKEPGCNRRFTIRPDLNDHIRKCHTGERPYHCLVCGKRFLTGSVFYQHRLIHRGERRYGCNECGKRFYRADALKNHQRIHTGEKPYACSYCTKCFRQRGDRDKHVRARHGHLEANIKAIENNYNLIDNSRIIDTRELVFIGDRPFPKSMFKAVVADIDGGNST